MAMTRARWFTGALIGAAAMIVASEALATYVAERLVVGIVAVVVLMGVLAIGLASLARARRYIARELSALRGETPSGALFEGRRAQLVALCRRGVEPDLDVLADATAAEEAERGYTGRYLVATTVLIGLVGTFGGLMETLGARGAVAQGRPAVERRRTGGRVRAHRGPARRAARHVRDQRRRHPGDARAGVDPGRRHAAPRAAPRAPA